jgi:serine protease Do
VVTLDDNVLTGQQITVNLSTGESLPATLVGRDSAKDVAAIKVAKTGLLPVTFAVAGDVQLAEWAIVIGSPLDYRNTVSLGIISGLNRSLDLGNGQTLSGLVQMDAAVSPGNSGGGCFDGNGHFVGMPEIYLPPGQTGAENISFAIPSEVVLSVAKTLVGK